MDLIKVELAGFRRFGNAGLDVLGGLVSIVGPNEAGKSSLLEALTRLNDDEPLQDRDMTRAAMPTPDSVVLTARFSLDDEDKAAIAHIREASQAKRFIVTKRRNGRREGLIEPPVRRDRRPRTAALKLLRKVGTSRWAGEHTEMLAEGWPAADEALNSKEANLSGEQIASISSLAQALESEPDRTNPKRLAELLRADAESESRPHPTSPAVSVLMARMPEFLLFGPEERSLASVYDLTSAADEPPPALENFANLARLNLKEARDLALGSDFGGLETIVRKSDAVLEDVFSSGWRQSVLQVQLRLDRTELRPMVQNVSGSFTELGERSDGLRIFVALVGYLARAERAVLPVLLIDEAETHLHYDAQADLIRILSSQDAAAKVIYTTHSAGCLPFDLGTGIRVVRMMTGDRSEIDNSFWSSGPGFTPLVMAMGAAALAFTPTRRAVIGEGVTESILLPSLLREAVDAGELDYQIAPGLANASEDVIRELDLEAARVAFLVDGDKAGKDKKKFLVKVGVPADRIVLLGEPDARDVVLEDLLPADLYRSAVNAELGTWREGISIPASEIKNRGRVAAVAAWCKRAGVPPPDKRRVATQVLTLRGDRRMTTTASRALLRKAHASLRAILDRPAF